jgi:hypothetical protein
VEEGVDSQHQLQHQLQHQQHQHQSRHQYEQASRERVESFDGYSSDGASVDIFRLTSPSKKHHQ